VYVPPPPLPVPLLGGIEIILKLQLKLIILPFVCASFQRP